MSITMIIALIIFVLLVVALYKLNSAKPKTKVINQSRLSKPPQRSVANNSEASNSQASNSQANNTSPIETSGDDTLAFLTTTDPDAELEPQVELPTLPEKFLTFSLIHAADLAPSKQKLISDITKNFNKPHPLILPLVKGVFEPSELFDLIKTDAEMTAKILNVVNSPLFALRQPITNVNHAIIFLGITEVKNIALKIAMQNEIKIVSSQQNQVCNKIWQASALASSICLLFTKEMGEENAAELSTQCLLSYLGDLAMLSYKPKLASFYSGECSLFERTATFQEKVGFNTSTIGEVLMHRWKLPSSIKNAIKQSLQPLTRSFITELQSPKNMQNIILTYVSCRIADFVAFNGLTSIDTLQKLTYESITKVEFYYIQQGIDVSGFSAINTVFEDATFRQKLNKLIQQSSP